VSLPPANPDRGFKLMKIAGIRTSLSMPRTHPSSGDAARFGGKSHQNA
jgi:hypothetical protein